MRKPWLVGLTIAILVVAITAVRLRKVRKPPDPPAARLPASARILLQPYRQDSVDLTVASQGELSYRVGMQAGATLVYAWSTGNSRDTLSYDFAGQPMSIAAAAHKAFVAQSSGWYRWHWKNPAPRPVIVHFKLRGYYDPPAPGPADLH